MEMMEREMKETTGSSNALPKEIKSETQGKRYTVTQSFNSSTSKQASIRAAKKGMTTTIGTAPGVQSWDSSRPTVLRDNHLTPLDGRSPVECFS